MALCPSCSRRPSLSAVFTWEPGQRYTCRWCRAALYVDARRFHLAAFGVAYVTLVVGFGSYVVIRSLGVTALLLAMWLVLSPLVFSSWMTLRFNSDNPSPKAAAHHP